MTFKYVPTHRSIQDGSDAMKSDLSDTGGFFLVNEDGFEFEADPMEWREVDPADPWGYMEGIRYL